ncbi:Tetratricopeptide repeat [Dillenia turbinata]|uniref:Tetratricopeptide repeat n=1 Tax=Dillenia turbinata TaxID=194707 RepID=A0AAN8UQN8_9MAGN
MSTMKLLLSELRRGRSISSLSPLSRLLTLQPIPHHFQNPNPILKPPSPESLLPSPSNGFHFKSNPNFFNSSNFFNIRSYSSRSSSSSDDSTFEDHGIEFADEPFPDSEISNSAVNTGLEAVDKVIGTGDDMIFPVRAAISFIDGVHEWLTIATSTVIFRLTLLPFIVIQLQKSAKIAELFPKFAVQISFSKFSYGGGLGLLVKWYKNFLRLMSVFLLYVSFQMPQASLVYWVTNLSFSCIQLVTLRHPAVRELLVLPNKETSERTSDPDVLGTIRIRSSDQPTKLLEVSVKELSPKQLLAVSVQMLAKGHQDKAIPLLRLALDKDPEYVRALTVMGQTLIQKGLLGEAIEHLERAIAKLFLSGQTTKLEDADMLIIASQWAGVAHVRKGQFAEGLVHLERIAQLKEPEDPKSKVHYFDGLLLLASTLSNVGRNAEAADYMRRVAAYNPDYNYLVEQCENGGNDLAADLTSSRRGGH